MTEDYVIHTTRPDLCLDFYTRILGLRFEERPPRRVAAKKNQPLQAVATASQTAPPLDAQEKSENAPAACMAGSTMFKINHLRIAPLRRNAAIRRAHAKPLPRVPGSAGVDMFFVARHPLEAIQQHLQALCWTAVCEPVAYCGSIHQLRILYLLDPDGNRLRLVELGC